MGRIQSSVGLVTGIEIVDTVNQLMSVAAQPREALAGRQKVLAAQQAAVTDLTALTLGVQLAIQRFKTPTLFSQRTTTSSVAGLLAATASSAVPTGQYQFVPVRQAQTHQLLSSGVVARDQALGAGSLTFRFGGQVNQGVSLDDLNGGSGVSRGKIKITDRSGATGVIDLRFAQTIDDVLAAINASDEIEVEAVAAGNQLRLTDSTGGAGNLRVQEVSGGTTAADLGLAGIDVAADQATGQDIVSLFNGLELDRLNDGSGLGLRSELADLEITFRDNSAALQIDLNPAGEPEPRTLGEIVDRLNAADPARLQAAISGDGQRLVLTDLTADGGGTFAASNPMTGGVAEELGLTNAASGATLSGARILSGLKTTLVGSLAGGGGLGTLGGLQLTDRSGATVTVDLAGAETLDDAIELVNAAGLGIRAQYNTARNGLALVDTTGVAASNLIAASGDATDTAAKLGLTGNVAADQINGASLARQVVGRNTLLSSYGGGEGVSLGSIVVTDSDGNTGSVNLATLEAETIGDVIDAINGISIGIEARINDAGDGLVLIDTAGGSGRLSVSDVGSGTTAADLQLLGDSADVTIGGQPAQQLDGSTTVTVEIDAEETLDDVVAKINELGRGVTAGVVSQASGSLRHHLSLVSGTAGKAGELVVDGSGAGLSFQDLSAAQDALIQFGSGPAATLFTSASNRFDDVLEGLDITLTGTSLDPVTITVAQTSESAAGALQTFVDNYNKLRDKLALYTSYSPEAGTKGTLFGSSETLRIDADLSQALTRQYFGAGEIQSLAELGVTINDQGKLAFDKTQFNTRYAADPQAVLEFFTDEDNGFAVEADAVLERLVGRDNSVLVARAETLSRQVEVSEGRIDAWDDRLDRQRERLLTEFYRIELVVSKLRNSLTAIGQIQAIPPFTGQN
ncbi:MAG: flagellar filament capping protein FliD [Pirellulaceae bacterium]